MNNSNLTNIIPIPICKFSNSQTIPIPIPIWSWLRKSIPIPIRGKYYNSLITGAKKRLNGVKKRGKNSVKNCFCRGDFRLFLSKNVHIWDQFFPVLFPKDFETLKILDIRLREVVAKRCLNGTSIVNKLKQKSIKTIFASAI